MPGGIIQRIQRCLNDPIPPIRPAAAAAARSPAACRSIGSSAGLQHGRDTCFNRPSAPPLCADLRAGSQPAGKLRARNSRGSRRPCPTAWPRPPAATWRWKPRAGGDWSRAVTQAAGRRSDPRGPVRAR
jgi:hypothetical protein